MFILKFATAILTAIVFIFNASGITTVIPYLDVIPGIVKVGADYVSLKRNENAVTEKELSEELEKISSNIQHPFILADKADFDIARNEYKNNLFSDYTYGLNKFVFDNANALLDMNLYPVLEYVLDEEDSILPISREVISRMVILGYAWQVTGENRYAERAWAELENVCGYDDWCTGHFLATAEMAFAVSIGYDWFYDYLTAEQRDYLAAKTFEYAVKPALSKNYLKNWFTWSKNNWNSICYSGIGIACMTFSEYFSDESAEFLSMCYANMPIAFENFTPDGVYAEGPGYSQSGMNSVVFFVATSKNYFGTDFGMSDIDGFKELGYFPVYITTPTGVFNFGDNKARMCFTPSLHWYASEYDAPLLSVYQMWDTAEDFVPDTSGNVERSGSGKEDALSLLWYNRAYTPETVSFDNEPLAVHLKSDVGQPLVLMRSGYLDKNATFAGVKAGYNYTNHGDLDIGTFVFDSMGERWAEELGPGSYDAPDYFVNFPAGGRWKNYCKRAEGQNTLVINPEMTLDDQYAFAECDFDYFNETVNGGECRIDMTDAYRMNGAKDVSRTFELYDNRTSLRITDKINCVIPSEIYWFMHTKAEITVSDDRKTAILELNGKKMKATLCNDGEFSVMSAESLTGKYEYDEDYSDICKLTVHLEDTASATICITLEPMI